MANKKVEVNKVEVSAKAQETEAVVYDGNREVRRYSPIDHGESYAKLAEEFASKRKLTIKFEEIKQGIKCPSCGHVFKL